MSDAPTVSDAAGITSDGVIPGVHSPKNPKVGHFNSFPHRMP